MVTAWAGRARRLVVLRSSAGPARFFPGFSRIPHIDCRSNWFAHSCSLNRFAAVPDQREANHARFQIRLGAVTPNLSDDCLIRLHLQHRISALGRPREPPYPLPARKRQAAGLRRWPPCVAKLVNHPWKTARPGATDAKAFTRRSNDVDVEMRPAETAAFCA